jgi:hypothetical protein
MKSHTSTMMSLGKGCAYAVSQQQQLNTTSSTEVELVGVSNVMGLVLWTWRFLKAQGYMILNSGLGEVVVAREECVENNEARTITGSLPYLCLGMTPQVKQQHLG